MTMTYLPRKIWLMLMWQIKLLKSKFQMIQRKQDSYILLPLYPQKQFLNWTWDEMWKKKHIHVHILKMSSNSWLKALLNINNFMIKWNNYQYYCTLRSLLNKLARLTIVTIVKRATSFNRDLRVFIFFCLRWFMKSFQAVFVLYLWCFGFPMVIAGFQLIFYFLGYSWLQSHSGGQYRVFSQVSIWVKSCLIV